MKTTKNILAAILIMGFAGGCNEGIDSISRVSPGEDESAPVVTITSPSTDKVVIPFTQVKTNMSFSFNVVDDIEVESIVLKVNGTQVASYSGFLDYRRVLRSFIYNDLPIGDHTVTVEATDTDGKTTTQSFAFELTNIYEAMYDGEIFYMPFEADVNIDLLSGTEATKVGSPTFTAGKIGSAFQGANNAYITFPTNVLGLASEFSIVWWYKVNVTPERSGILVIGPPGINTRTSGFRVFREGGRNNFKANIGLGPASDPNESWNDGGAIPAGEWNFMTFTVGGGKTRLYANGTLLREASYTGSISWADTDFLAIGSGGPRFSEWGHASDLSAYDEIRVFDKVLTVAEINAIKVATN